MDTGIVCLNGGSCWNPPSRSSRPSSACLCCYGYSGKTCEIAPSYESILHSYNLPPGIIWSKSSYIISHLLLYKECLETYQFSPVIISAPFIPLYNGSICSNVRYQISSAAECQLAADIIGLNWGGTQNADSEPPACYLAISGNKVYFNESPTPIDTNLFRDTAQICRRSRGKSFTISWKICIHE